MRPTLFAMLAVLEIIGAGQDTARRAPKKYKIIYADPPWNFGNRLRNGTKEANGTINTRYYFVDYQTMKTKDICALPISDIAGSDCALFIWSTDAHVPDCLSVISAWGFKYSTVAFVWQKKEKSGVDSCHVGFWTNKGCEICFLATKGSMSKYIVNRTVRQLVVACRDKHSKKPQEVRDRINAMFGNIPRIELFARQRVEGWDAWGNEIEGSPVLGEESPAQNAAEICHTAPNSAMLQGLKPHAGNTGTSA